jgi:hypothetical protein
MNNIYLTPSFYAHIINGLLLFISLIIFYKNYNKISNLEPYKLLLLTLFFSIGIGVHGLSHLGLEKNYNYNPIANIINI